MTQLWQEICRAKFVERLGVTRKSPLSKYFRRRPPVGHITGAAGPHSAVSRHTSSNAFSGSRGFTGQLDRGRGHDGASDPDRENFEPSRYSDFWKEISAMRFAIPSP